MRYYPKIGTSLSSPQVMERHNLQERCSCSCHATPCAWPHLLPGRRAHRSTQIRSETPSRGSLARCPLAERRTCRGIARGRWRNREAGSWMTSRPHIVAHYIPAVGSSFTHRFWTCAVNKCRVASTKNGETVSDVCWAAR